MTATPAGHQAEHQRGAPASTAGVLVGVDLSGIQRFIFEGRRLLDAIGRATLVADLTDTGRGPLRPLLHAVPGRRYEILRDAGGALYVAFTDPRHATTHARTFTGRYTRLLRDLSDRLAPVVAHVSYGELEEPAPAQANARGAGGPASETAPARPELESPAHVGIEATAGRATATRAAPDRLAPATPDARRDNGAADRCATQAEALRRLPAALQAARARSATHLPALGLGVTALCEVTGRPAELLDDTRERGPAPERVARDIVSARARAREWHRANSAAWLRGVYPPEGFERLELPTDVDHLGREIGDISRLAVIHLDFNGLGDLLRRYHLALTRDGADVVAGMRGVSADIARLTEGLARAVIRSVAAAITVRPGRGGDGEQDVAAGAGPATGDPAIVGFGAGGALRPHTDRRTVYVPVRPVVVAGDDLTIICDARLAWSVTRFALRWLDADPATLGASDPRTAMARRAGEEPWGRTVTPGDSGPAADTGTVTGVPSAGIGIAVQPVGAPLSVGYDICAALCERAKEHRKAAQERHDDHVVAWSHLFDDPGRVLARLDEARATGEPGGAVADPDGAGVGLTGGDGGPAGPDTAQEATHAGPAAGATHGGPTGPARGARGADAGHAAARTALPMTGAELHAFLRDYLGERAPSSLRGPAMANQRSWLLSRLAPLLNDGHDPAAELARRTEAGLPARLPEPFSRGRLLDAIGLLDIHVDVPLTDRVPAAR